jgi:hypothetical protein
MEGWYHPQSRFYGNSVGSLAGGQMDVHFTKHKETYRLSWPDVYCRGIIIGKLVFEYSGTPLYFLIIRRNKHHL